MSNAEKTKAVVDAAEKVCAERKASPTGIVTTTTWIALYDALDALKKAGT